MQQVLAPSSNNFHPGQNQPDLFSQSSVSPPISPAETEYRKENIVDQAQNTLEKPINQTIIYQKAAERKISKIIIYYSDNTFETFNADNSPL